MDMEDSAIVEHQNQRKRSNSNSCDNAFAKFVPLASPLGDVDGGVFQEPNPEGHDNGHKRHKRNSDVLLSESAYISSFSSSSSLSKPSVASHSLQFSSPSTSTKHFNDTRTSPSSIASKFNMQYQELDAKYSQSLSAVSYNWKEDQIDLGSVGSMAAEQLSKRPKVGEIYETIKAHRESTVKRLKDLCNEEPTIDVGIEMADAASLLKLMSFSTNEIESAGQKAQRGAMMLLQAEILRKNGLKLLCECQNLLRDSLQ